MEYLLRFAGSPEKMVFLKDAMNVIDVLSIFPFFLDLFVLGEPQQVAAHDPYNVTLAPPAPGSKVVVRQHVSVLVVLLSVDHVPGN